MFRRPYYLDPYVIGFALLIALAFGLVRACSG